MTETGRVLEVDEDIWQLVGKTYETYLEKYPKSTTFRTEYFQWAVNAKKWDVAREQLKLLGDLWDRFAIGEMEFGELKVKIPE